MKTMFDREFFSSKLGIAALASIIAMISFNAFALNQQICLAADANPVDAPLVELA
ncbi:hypothetical protein KK137_16330 [Croceibacterium sp. LX-88]|uniref:Uncharacterized protein n=1 Tax=Croceibacterium selenioxidans TaxID=2838833 RepID=A0ABS5W809_9SPHN|nr:hypothetical protein [Croceibacterium selenioxidans]MBT2135905.1 hypothetical protein [Croceibacterium selenioxidans]